MKSEEREHDDLRENREAVTHHDVGDRFHEGHPSRLHRAIPHVENRKAGGRTDITTSTANGSKRHASDG
jgi:hypothetical protein